MEITSVKEQRQGGYLVNGTLSVPPAPGNRHYQAVQQWIAEGNTPDPAETDAERLARLRGEKQAEIDAELSANMAPLRQQYPLDERETWHEQIRETEAHAAGKATPMLSAIATEKGVTVDDAVTRVKQNQQAFAEQAGQAVGIRQRRTEQLAAAATEDEIKVV